MEEQGIRRRRRRRRSRSRREFLRWMTFVIATAKRLYHWVALVLLIVFILMVGFVYPAFA